MESLKINYVMASSTNKNTNPSQDMNIDWKSLFSPCPVDIESQTPQQVKFAKRYNMVFWCAYGTLTILAVILAVPDVEKMIVGPLLMLVFFLAFSAIAHSIQIKGRAGRKKLAPIPSFAECFTDQVFYQKVVRFITEAHNTERPMTSVECHALLDYILKNPTFLISGVSLSRLSKLLIKEYGPSGLLSFSTERAVSKAEPTENDMERIKWYFSK